MALVKTGGRDGSKANGAYHESGAGLNGTAPPKPQRAMLASSPRKQAANGDLQRRRQRTFGRQQKAAERVASATLQMASGIAEAASACEELSKAMEQIATGAEQAASAAEESQRAMTRIAQGNRTTTEGAGTSLRKTEALQSLLGNVGGQIGMSIASISRSSERQVASVSMMEELDKQAADIGDIVKAVARIADQANLLALNAAIEAARAGQHGKGFAVVADEVRTLAETSEKSTRDIQELVGEIQQRVKSIAEGINASAVTAKAEAENGQVVTMQLDQIRTDMTVILAGGQDILTAARESDGATQEALKGSEAISAAAQQQSSACEEAVNTVAQQSTALTQSDQASSELSELAEELKNSTDITKSAEEVAAAAEQLSSAVEEINRASMQIMTALEQINRGTQQQSAATQQSAAAIGQIERGAQLTSNSARLALEKGNAIAETLKVNRASLNQMIAGVQSSVESNIRSRDQIGLLEQVSRRIDKIVDTISIVSIQTNMLAVNGSIEAARAGEFGKGFMVVSTDIRNLARDSAENAEQIKDLVKAVQDQIVAVRRDIDETTVMGLAEVEKNKAVTANLAIVAEDMSLVLEGNRSIEKGAAETQQALQEAKLGIDQISAAALQASQSANQAAQAAREQAKGAEELAAAIEEISSLADELQNNEAA